MLAWLTGEHVELSRQLAPDPWQVINDPSQVDQSRANLCVNGRDAIADIGKGAIEPAHISLDTKSLGTTGVFAPGAYVHLAQSDNRCGLEWRSRLCSASFLTTSGVGEGTGLGHTTAHGAVKKNDECINSLPDRNSLGTTLTSELPRYAGRILARRLDLCPPQPLQGYEIIPLNRGRAGDLGGSDGDSSQRGLHVLVTGPPGEAIRLARANAKENPELMCSCPR